MFKRMEQMDTNKEENMEEVESLGSPTALTKESGKLENQIKTENVDGTDFIASKMDIDDVEEASREGSVDMNDEANSQDENSESQDSSSFQRRERRKANSKYRRMEQDDLEKMLKWKNGVGLLPGTDLKFCKSASGLDLINQSSGDDEIDDTKHEQSPSTSSRRVGRKKKFASLKDEDFDVSQLKSEVDTDGVKLSRYKQKKRMKIGKDKVLKCETCGCSGNIKDFRSSGRFCSQRCVGAYASKRRAEMIAQQFARGERPVPHNPKKTVRKKKEKTDKELMMTIPGDINAPPRKPITFSDKLEDDSIIYYEKVGYEKPFDSDEYLEVTQTASVPEDVFVKEYFTKETYFTKGSEFKATMKLECIDPKHQSCFCVASVVDVHGARLRLHFDGWSENYDFWINADSSFLFPCGWCERNNQTLMPPKGMGEFSWSTYLEHTGCEPAPEHLFRQDFEVTHGFCKNMKLEAVDRKNPDLICVASVTNVIGDHLLIHFDGWDDQYDYWCRDDSPFIHPVGWCAEKNVPLIPPTDDMLENFKWDDYLESTNSIAAPSEIFKPRTEPNFELKQKLEAIDPRNPSIVRLATIVEKEDYRIKLHFDGWDDAFDAWFDTDSVDLHPIKWAEKTGQVLDYPPSGVQSDESLCGTRGCRGIGHFKGVKFTTHHTSFGCPYTLHNLNRILPPVVDRLSENALGEEHTIANRVYKMKPNTKDDDFDESIVDQDGREKHKPAGRTVGRPPKTNVYHRLRGRGKKRRGGFRRKGEKFQTVGKTHLSKDFTEPPNNVHEEHSNTYLTKPVPPTLRPACQAKHKYPVEKPLNSLAIPWSQDDVNEFVKNLGFDYLIPSFQEQRIDGQALLLLSQSDLVRHFKLKLGPALRLYDEISKL